MLRRSLLTMKNPFLFCSTAYPILERSGQLRKSRLRGGAKGEATGAHPGSGLAPGAK